MENNEIAIGSTTKKKFVTALFGGFLFFGILLATLGFSGTIFAVPLGGMGDFYVTFDKLEGKGFTLNPEIGETGNQDAAPMVRNEIESATIENLHIYKDLKMPTGNWVRINIKASQPTTIKGLIQDARFIDANLSFDNLAIEESNTSQMSVKEAYHKNWAQNADTVTITDAKIVTDYLFQNMVTLNGAEISVENIKGPEQTKNVSVNNKSDQSFMAGAQNDNGNSGGGGLPSTASNLFLPILIGAFLLVVGIILIVIKRRRHVMNESDQKL